jgi:hypothetical protein
MPEPDDQVRRGYRHWSIIGGIVAVLIVVFLLRR